jgi:hypothetical protein
LPFCETQANDPDIAGILSVRRCSDKKGKPYRCKKRYSHE